MRKNKETKIRKAKAKKEKKPYKKDLVKKSFADPFILFCSELSHEDHARITELFSEVRAHCLLPKHDLIGIIRVDLYRLTEASACGLESALNNVVGIFAGELPEVQRCCCIPFRDTYKVIRLTCRLLQGHN